jgi:FolB domain-containing protein
MDRIIISDLRARCIIGLNAEERREKQDVVVNLVIVADLRRAGRSDRFEDTVDYRQMKKAVLERVEASQFLLLEALAQAIADTCLADLNVRRVRVRVDKPSALRFARSVAVQITRSRAAQDDQP